MSREHALSNETVLVRKLATELDVRSLQAANPTRYPFLLQSTASVSALGRYDILFAFPGESLCLSALTQLTGPAADESRDFLRALDRWWQRERSAPAGVELPFNGGWFLYLGYELAAQVESTLTLTPDSVLPTAFAVRCPAAFITDRKFNTTYAVCEIGKSQHLDAMTSDALQFSPETGNSDSAAGLNTEEEPAERFLAAVNRAKEYVADGDIYQANLSRYWRAVLGQNMSPTHVYQRLCAANPAPFAGLIRWQNVSIICSSPERLIAVRDGEMSTRPIAGTRPRGLNTSSDSALSEELFGNAKERAEHVMLIDLERNDLGRVCEPGSVEVNEFMLLESYAHVHHIVSNVRGRLRHSVTPGDAIRAVFPGGTITGCPKVRCMHIIAELERSARGAYTGSFGYLNRDGSMDLNILIRTMVMSGNSIELRAGSGIVADSDPQAELAETRAKAKGLLMALN